MSKIPPKVMNTFGKLGKSVSLYFIDHHFLPLKFRCTKNMLCRTTIKYLILLEFRKSANAFNKLNILSKSKDYTIYCGFQCFLILTLLLFLPIFITLQK